MEKLDYIFLDLDGPILDGKQKHYNCYKDIINKNGGNPIEIDVYWQMKKNKIRRDDILSISSYQDTYESFYNEWISNIEKKKYLYFDKLKPMVKDTIDSWRDKAKKIVLVTMRNNRKNLLWQLSNFELITLFDEVISCPSNHGCNKYQVLGKIGFNSAVFIGDTEEDMNTAKLLGIPSIAITNGLREKKFLSANYYFEEICYIDIKKIKEFDRR